MRTIRSTLTLLALCVTATGCGTMEFLVTGKDPDQGTPQTGAMCPHQPTLSIVRTETGYAMDETDMQKLLHYVTDLEYAAGCER